MYINNKKIILSVFSFCFYLVSLFPLVVHATTPPATVPAPALTKTPAVEAGKDSAGCDVEGGLTSCKLDNPLKNDPIEVTTIIGNALKGVIALVGAITLVMFVYGGFNWLISGGSPEKIKTGRDTMIWATIGLVAVFAAYGTLLFVFDKLLSG